MKKIHIKGYQHIGKNKPYITTLIPLPTIMVGAGEYEYVLIVAWLFWSLDIYLDRDIKQ